jgi:hypothetical protein
MWKTATLEELTKKYANQLQGRSVTDRMRAANLANITQQLAIRQAILKQSAEEREQLVKEKSGLNVDSLGEQRRIVDVKAKTERVLADCDLLVIPRMTLRNVNIGDAIPNRVYKLDPAQVAAIKDFLKAGKPVLACFGPSNEPPSRQGMMNPLDLAPDDLERMLTELGFRFPRQTVLFNVESKSFAERRGGLEMLSANVEVPPVKFDWPVGAGQTSLTPAEDLPLNPIRESMRLTAQGVGKGQALDLRIRHPRPVYYQSPAGKPPAFDPIFMMSDERSWNDEQPFPSRERTPRYEPSKGDDLGKGTLEEKRRGPFPIAAAAEVTLPQTWYTDKDAKPATVRLAAIGHGGLFVGSSLSPLKEKLLLDVTNWLLGRDDLLTKTEQTWQYPRVPLSSTANALWQWGTRLGMPVLFVYLGLVVLMVRRLR